MSRYMKDYGGIPAKPFANQGMDPNHRNGYQGMRMYGGPRQAAYGWHRWMHERDLEMNGGFHGRHEGLAADSPGRIGRPPRRYDQDLRGGGGVHDLRYETQYLRDYNADSIRFRDEGARGGGRQERERSDRDAGAADRSRRRGYDTGFSRSYGNRGVSDGGYSDSWNPGSMRGRR
jgi:hypothetical protein